jgi:hypothetical protein
VTALVGFSVFFQISPSEFLFQMAAPSNVFWDHAGHLHTNALHWESFPHLLWESLSLLFYTEPSQYDGVEYREEGVLVFYRLPTEGYAQGGKFRLGDAEIRNSKVQGTQDVDRFGPRGA